MVLLFFYRSTFEIETPQDRNSSFEPDLVKKRQRILADNLSKKIMGLYKRDVRYLHIPQCA